MGSPKKPINTMISSGGSWYKKMGSQNIAGTNWRTKLTPEEKQAMEAEARWAFWATKNDAPGPRRIRVHITKSRRNLID